VIGPRASRAIHVIAPVLIVLYALLSVLEWRSLHADGSWAFVQSLMAGGYWIGDPYRLVADMIAETPISVLALLGVSSRSALVIAHGVGYILIPSLAWSAALWISRRSVVFAFLLLGYCATALTSGFLAIGEYNFLFAFAALCFAAIVRFWTRPTLGMAWVVVGSAFVVMSSHGLTFLLSPLLLVSVLLPMRSRGRPKTGEMPMVIAGGLLLAGSVLGVLAVVHPYASRNVERASDLMTPLSENHQLQFVLVWLLLLPLAVAARRPLVRRITTGVLLAGLVVLVLTTALWASPWVQHASRAWAAIVLFVLLAEALVVVWPTMTSHDVAVGPEARPVERRLTGLSFALFIALLVPSAVQTVQFGSFVRAFDAYVNAHAGFVDNADFVAQVPTAERYGWPATFPSLSVALGRRPGSAIVLNPADTVWDPPFDDRDPPDLPARYAHS